LHITVVSNDFAVKRSKSECLGIKSCGKRLYAWYTDFKIFSSLSSDVKGLSKKEVPWSPLNPPLYCILFIIIVFPKKVNKQVRSEFSTRVGTKVVFKISTETSWSSAQH